jgi:GNAT superfamily N-acetyltransferase
VNIRQVTDLDLLKDFHAVLAAAMDHDYVALPADPIEELVPIVEGHQPSGEHVTMWVGYDGDVPVASMELVLWTLDNLGSANLDGAVHPDHRRRGHGRELLAFALDRVREAGRNRLFLGAAWRPDDSDGMAFSLLRSVGARPVLDDVRRLLDLRTHAVGEPHPVPDGYQVRQWVDRAPDEVVDGLAYLLHRMVLDAPMGDMDYEAETWDAARYRDTEADAKRRNRTRFSTAVVHTTTGQVAGMTEIVVNADRHDVAYQWNTIVDPEHRGRRLGMVLKTWNHHYLVEQVEGIRYLNTWNAASNSFMIAVNEDLGFRPAERWSQWQLDL